MESQSSSACEGQVAPEGSYLPHTPSEKGPPRPLVAWKVPHHKEACALSAEREEDFRELKYFMYKQLFLNSVIQGTGFPDISFFFPFFFFNLLLF